MSASSPTESEPEIINHSTADVTADNVESEQAEIPQRPPPLSRASTLYREKCWICLSTRDEDPPSPPEPPTEWRSPCSCSLQAHESCLLDWVADQEAPRRSGRSQTIPDQILCPQCKSEIKIQRPRDPIVALARRIDKSYSRATLPVLATSVVGTLFAGCWAYGRAATYVMFGPEHSKFIHEWTLHEGHGRPLSYALIPLCLIFSRTSYSDFVIPIGQVTLLSTQITTDGPFIDWEAAYWPPHPSTAFAVLPVIKQLYTWSYEKCFGAMNRRWLDEIMPRHGEDYENRGDNIPEVLNEAQQMAQEEEIQEGVVFEVEFNVGGGQDDNMPQVEEVRDGDAENPQPAANGNGNNVVAGRNINEYVTDTHSVMGSLLLPLAARVSGELLCYLLPHTWSSPRWNYYNSSGRVGFFATKWGRNLAGGLAFCFLKDMVLMYCRWRLADSHKRRKIMNFDKAAKKYVRV